MRTRISMAVLLLACLSQTAAAAEEQWQPVIELEGRTNSDRSIFSPKLLMPLAQDRNSMVFADLRMRVDDAQSEEYNVGLGYRQMRGDWILGGYGFVDYLNSASNNHYWQATAGVEALSETWEARANGYLPQANEHTVGTGGFVIGAGGAFGISGLSRERALPGIDAEIGYRLPITPFDLRLFGGGYYFDAKNFDTVAGPKLRTEMTLDNRVFSGMPDGMQVTFGVQYQNDGARENTATALAALRIPLGGAPARKGGLERRMTNFIERDIDIIAGTGSSGVIPATVTLNGHQYTGIASTFDANTPVDLHTIGDTLTAAGNGAMIVFDGSAGVINPIVSFVPLQGQAIVGGGATVTAQGGGHTVTGVLPGTRPTIVRSVLAYNPDTTVKNVDVNISGGTAVFAGADNALIEDVTAVTDYNLGGYGVRITGDNVTLRNVTADSPYAAVSFNDLDGGTLDNVTVTSTGGIGLELDASSHVTGTVDASGATTPCHDAGGNHDNAVTLVGGGTCP